MPYIDESKPSVKKRGFSNFDFSSKTKLDYDPVAIKNLFNTIKNFWKVGETASKYGDVLKYSAMLDEPEYVKKAMERISERYELKYRFVPSKRFRVNEYGTGLEKKPLDENNEKISNLEKKVLGVLILFSFTLAAFLFSLNLIGYTILNFNSRTSDILGVFLFFIGIIFSYLYLKRRN